MEKESTELENLKKKLFSQEQSPDEILVLRAVMREVGGYEQLMKLPISAYHVIAESISKEREAEKAEYDKIKARKKK